MAQIQASSYSSDLTPSLRTSMCHGYGPQKEIRWWGGIDKFSHGKNKAEEVLKRDWVGGLLHKARSGKDFR